MKKEVYLPLWTPEGRSNAFPQTIGTFSDGQVLSFDTEEAALEYNAEVERRGDYVGEFGVLAVPEEAVELIGAVIRAVYQMTRLFG